MLKSLKIQNFKGWEDTGTIKMSPITLFFGTNSSGKSSIGQFLMMLKQTMDSSDRKAVFYTGGKSSAVQLGSFYDMVFHHDTARKILFEYEWMPPKNINIKDSISQQNYIIEKMKFSGNVGTGEKERNHLMLYNFIYSLFSQEGPITIGMKKKSESSSIYDLNSTGYNLVRKKMRAWNLHTPGKFYAFPDEVVAYYQNADFVQEINFNHETLFRSLYYLGPLRTKMDRSYTWTRNEPESVGFNGENAIAAILSAEKRKLNLKYRSPTKYFQQIIVEELKKMGLIEEFKVTEISAQRQEYEVKIKTKGATDWVDIPDVGFGISQVLPVLIQCFYAPSEAIILVEQPEIHLHPSAQAALADVMIDVINSGEYGKPRNIQLIIETHSEHFLRRLQRRIAEDESLQQKVSAYFADITKNPAKLDQLDIDMFGNILNWPKDFFGNMIGDVIAHDEKVMERKIIQSRKNT